MRIRRNLLKMEVALWLFAREEGVEPINRIIHIKEVCLIRLKMILGWVRFTDYSILYLISLGYLLRFGGAPVLAQILWTL